MTACDAIYGHTTLAREKVQALMVSGSNRPIQIPGVPVPILKVCSDLKHHAEVVH